MQLKIDNTKTYAIALEGGGAKGAYEVGAWKAMDEAGIKYNAVSGTSIGALNGAMMATHDLQKAIDSWKDMRYSRIFNVDEQEEKNMQKVFYKDVEPESVPSILGQLAEIIKNRGLDIAPLRELIHELADTKGIKESDVEYFVSTISISDMEHLEIKMNDLPEDQICDMILASAYHPSFKLEKLDGKLYIDGGLMDNLPLHVLVVNGYKDIIAVRLPSHGRVMRFDMPEDVTVTEIASSSDLGYVLNFDTAQCISDMHLGYLDASRVLYGLNGEKYYIDRTMDEASSLNWLIERFYTPGEGMLRTFCEKDLSRMAWRLGQPRGDYYQIMIAQLERDADDLGIDNLKIYTDAQLVALVKAAKDR